jgi:5'-3' exoribonuclease 2
MAIDGVAPRAKMNQQRMRRFRAAKEAVVNRLKSLHEAEQDADATRIEELSDPDYLIKHDSNVITPGSPFFWRLTEHLRVFVRRQQQDDTGWKDIMVLLSDASVPGEGEHKIMNFIRSQRVQRHYDPNRRHVIYGLDADLIFLGLASHEPYFTVIRENVIDMASKNPEKGEIGPEFFHFVSLWVLRQYLDRDLRPKDISFEWNLEYAIDDFMFLCFSSGNDFIPGLPGFSIHSGAIKMVIDTYRNRIGVLGAYITQNGGIDFERFAIMMSYFSGGESRELDSIVNPSALAKEAQIQVNAVSQTDDPKWTPEPEDSQSKARSNPRDVELNVEVLKKQYYTEKFGFPEDSWQSHVPRVIEQYILGMKWTLNYYIHGCPSWSWYYPYHYAPCVSDFRDFSRDHAFYTFELSQPFKPLEQLMAVLPPQSAHALPLRMALLMTDSASPLKKYYPTTFPIDLNGSTLKWHGVVKIPFIDEEELRTVLNSTELSLSDEEMARNTFGRTRIFIPLRVAPGKDLPEEISVTGPPYWGVLTRLPGWRDQDMTGEFWFSEPILPLNAFLSFLIPGVVLPPFALDNQYDARKYETAWDKGAFDQEELERSWEIPLQIPGVPPGADYMSRTRYVERLREAAARHRLPVYTFPYQQQLVPPGYPPDYVHHGRTPMGYPPPPPGR